MKKLLLTCVGWCLVAGCAAAADSKKEEADALTHPDTAGWDALFADDLSNAVKPKDVWTVDEGVLTAAKDQAIWTAKDYDNFLLDLEFKTADGTNSGVIVYCSDTGNWIPNSVEIQIADDFAAKWANAPDTWHCAAIFGHLAPTKSTVKKPGEWNRFTVRCVDKQIDVGLNGEHVASMDMALWKSAKQNFSFGACVLSSSWPQPTRRMSAPSVWWKVVITGIEPPSRVNTGGRPKACSIALAAAAM